MTGSRTVWRCAATLKLSILGLKYVSVSRHEEIIIRLGKNSRRKLFFKEKKRGFSFSVKIVSVHNHFPFKSKLYFHGNN